MAKKGGGGKKSFWDNPFGGIFDFNRDGKEDFYELWMAQNIFEEFVREKETQNGHRQITYIIPSLTIPLGVNFVKTARSLI